MSHTASPVIRDFDALAKNVQQKFRPMSTCSVRHNVKTFSQFENYLHVHESF